MDANILIAVATLIPTTIATIVAVWGVRQWKTQKEYEVRFDLAKRFALLAYKFEDNFTRLQNPVGPYPSEYEDRPRKDNESEAEKAILDDKYAYLKRLMPLQVILQEMRTINWEANATIEKDFKSYIDKYAHIFHQMWIAIIIVFDPRNHKWIERDDENFLLEYSKQQKILYGHEEGKTLKDLVSKNTEELVELLSQYTFGGKNYRKRKHQNSSQEQFTTSKSLDLQNRIQELEEKLNAAQNRLSEIEDRSTSTSDVADFHAYQPGENQQNQN